jgi:hypothetical protein
MQGVWKVAMGVVRLQRQTHAAWWQQTWQLITQRLHTRYENTEVHMQGI